MAAEIERRGRVQRREVGLHVAPAVLEHQAVPGLRRVVAQVQAGIVGKVRRTEQAAVKVVGPAVQRADDVALGIAAVAQNHRLAMAADVGDQFDAAGRAHECAPLALLGQGVVVADLGNGECVTEVARAAREDALGLAAEQVGVEIGRDRELRAAAFERLAAARLRSDMIPGAPVGGVSAPHLRRCRLGQGVECALGASSASAGLYPADACAAARALSCGHVEPRRRQAAGAG